MTNRLKSKVLFTVDTGTYLDGLLKISRLLIDTGRFTPVAVFPLPYPNRQRDEQRCREAGVEVASELSNVSVTLREDRPLRRLMRRLLTFEPKQRLVAVSRSAGIASLKSLDVAMNQNPARHYFTGLARLRKIRRYLRAQHIHALFFAGDSAGYDTGSFIQAAKKLQIPTLVFPQWMAGPQEPAGYLFKDPDFSMKSWLNRFVSRQYPRWTYTFSGKKYLRLPGAQVLAKEWLGIAPPQPWILHSGFSDVIAVQSEAMKEYGVKLGLPAGQLHVVGSFEDDFMSSISRFPAEARAACKKKYHLPENKKILLTALPPDFLTGGTRPGVEFSTFDALVQFWVTALTRHAGFSVLISLHPSFEPSKMKYVEQWGATIVNEHISELLPLCDLFVASISSTIQWAIAQGKPTVNYDVYKYHYADYTSVDGVIYVERAADFNRELTRLTEDSAYLAEVRRRQEKSAPQWGTRDGHARERIVALFDTLISKNVHPTAIR